MKCLLESAHQECGNCLVSFVEQFLVDFDLLVLACMTTSIQNSGTFCACIRRKNLTGENFLLCNSSVSASTNYLATTYLCFMVPRKMHKEHSTLYL